MNRTLFSQKQNYLIFGLSFFSLLGIALLVSLTQHFYEVRNGTAGFKSFCNMSQAMNCDIVAASSYAELIPGLPLASVGAGWFLALFVISFFALNPYWKRESTRALFGMTALGTLFSLFYLAVMAIQIKTFCLFCLGVDALNLILLGLCFSLKPEGFSVHKLDFSKWKILVPISATSILIMIVGLRSLDQANMKASDLAELANSVISSTAYPVGSGEEFPAFGPKDAPITIVEFSDFQCPFCRIGAFGLNSVLNRYPHLIRIVFRNFPLDQSCNSQVQHSAHPQACEAARVAHCAYQMGKFEDVYQTLFEKQVAFGPGIPLELASQIGLDRSRLKSCVDSSDTQLAISRDIQEALTLGVQSTPTFFVNGHKMEGAFPVGAWQKIINFFLQKKKE